MTLSIRKRDGFTLVELMVVMGLIAFLTALVILVAPDVMAKDRTRDAAVQLQGALANARMRAMRDGLPRGVRLIIDSTSTGATFTTASSYQYLEIPPWLLFTNQTSAGNASTNPYLQFQYTLGTGTSAGQITSRACTINNLSTSQYTQLQVIIGPSPAPANNLIAPLPPILGVPTLGSGYWATIQPYSLTATQNASTGLWTCTFTLNVYPDSLMGASTNWVAYTNSTGTASSGPAYFGVYQSPRPLLGEPVVNLPVNTTVDLSNGVSTPWYGAVSSEFSLTGAPLGYDIVFGPSGQMMIPYGYGQVSLWVRDPTKGGGAGNTPIPNPNKDQGAFYSASPLALGGTTQNYATPQYQAFLPAAGEQLLVNIKANSGGTGVTPIFWPTAPLQTPYLYAQNMASAP